MAEDEPFRELHIESQPSPDAVARLEWRVLANEAILALGFRIWMPLMLHEVITSMREMADSLEAQYFPNKGEASGNGIND